MALLLTLAGCGSGTLSRSDGAVGDAAQPTADGPALTDSALPADGPAPADSALPADGPAPTDSAPPADGPAPTCDLWAATNGSDTASGSASAPLKTPQGLVDALAPGQVGCFYAGSYSFADLIIKKADLLLRPHLDDHVVLKGSIRINPEGTGTIIERLHLNGDGPNSKHGPNIYASDVILRDNEITNDNTGICIQVRRYGSSGPRPRDVLIERNRIHNCGELPPTNHHHGIYIGSADHTVVRDNWFYDNADRGVQQYPDADDSSITGNIIDSNKHGVNFSCDSSSCSQRNVVSGNIISNSSSWNVYGHSQGATPDGSNVLRDNCVWAAGGGDGIDSDSSFFSEQGNLTSKPAFVDAASKDYRLTVGDACLNKYTGTLSLPGS